MITKKSIRFFNDYEVRVVWDETNSKWWFSATDIVRAIIEQMSQNTFDEIVDKYVEMNVANGFLKTEGQNRTTTYLLGEAYAANNKLISKALAIGLQELKEQGEI